MYKYIEGPHLLAPPTATSYSSPRPPCMYTYARVSRAHHHFTLIIPHIRPPSLGCCVKIVCLPVPWKLWAALPQDGYWFFNLISRPFSCTQFNRLSAIFGTRPGTLINFAFNSGQHESLGYTALFSLRYETRAARRSEKDSLLDLPIHPLWLHWLGGAADQWQYSAAKRLPCLFHHSLLLSRTIVAVAKCKSFFLDRDVGPRRSGTCRDEGGSGCPGGEKSFM